jgi:hypothetical protein
MGRGGRKMGGMVLFDASIKKGSIDGFFNTSFLDHHCFIFDGFISFVDA